MREGRTSRMTDERIQALESIGFVWEAQRGGPRRRSRQFTDQATHPSDVGNDSDSLPTGDMQSPPRNQMAMAARMHPGVASLAAAAGSRRQPFQGPSESMMAGISTRDADAVMAAQLSFAAGARAAEQAMMLRAMSHEQNMLHPNDPNNMMPTIRPVVVPVPVPVAADGSSFFPPGAGYPGLAAPEQAALWQEQALRQFLPTAAGHFPNSGRRGMRDADRRQGAGRHQPREGNARGASHLDAHDDNMMEERRLKRQRIGGGSNNFIGSRQGSGAHYEGSRDAAHLYSSEVSTSLIRRVAAQLGEDQSDVPPPTSKMHFKKGAKSRHVLPSQQEESLGPQSPERMGAVRPPPQQESLAVRDRFVGKEKATGEDSATGDIYDDAEE